MKFKIDENLPADMAVLLQEAGYDAMTVLDQKLAALQIRVSRQYAAPKIAH